MNKVTISQTEYLKLRRQASAYKKITKRLFEAVVKDPISDIVDDFRKTNLYTNDFLKDLNEGLRKSSYKRS